VERLSDEPAESKQPAQEDSSSDSDDTPLSKRVQKDLLQASDSSSSEEDYASSDNSGETREGECEVEEILGHSRDSKGHPHFFVKWAKFDAGHNSWETLEALEKSPDVLEEYWKQGAGKSEKCLEARRKPKYKTAGQKTSHAGFGLYDKPKSKTRMGDCCYYAWMCEHQE
jgi:hypothetical protein